jgi:energy-coupling factor transporter ATP-binding protein EcfA2
MENCHFRAGKFSLSASHFALGEGVIALLAGESGCGKSTFLKLCSGMLQPESGKIIHNPDENPALMLQNPLYQVISASVGRELAFPLENMRLPMAEIEDRINEAARQWQIEDLMSRDLHSLSMGELQTVMLAVTMTMKRPLTLLDEPSSHLDRASIEKLYLNLRQAAKAGQSFIIASQNLFESQFCDELIVMRQGEIAGHFPTSEKALYQGKLLEWGLIFKKGSCGED